MSERWDAVAGSPLGLTDCGGCGSEVASTREKAATALCLTCHMTEQGVGDRWNLNAHPRFPGPGSDPLAYASDERRRAVEGAARPVALVEEREYRWACVRCLRGGPARGVDHAVYLSRVHDETCGDAI